MIATKRKMTRLQLIKRVETLEYVFSKLIESQRNVEAVIDYYIEMKKDEEKFQKFLDKKTKDAESPKSKSK
jgi:hypothetical protein|tara:strand:+ start:627 stop:839 length:213 start_codon:yes stop_codon:yes gene_type:complete